jgi:hypothetical protein
MSSDIDGHGGPKQIDTEALGRVEYLLFDSLVHHLIEKGVLTKNDALSVVQTAAEVVRSHMQDGLSPALQTASGLSVLERTYSSFEAVGDRSGALQLDGHNVRPLRPPLHGDKPHFPRCD